MTERTLQTLGAPVLRRAACPVGPEDLQLQTLIDDLLDTCRRANGVGIAAPQVGESLRLFIVASRPNARYPDAPWMEPTAMLDPEILAVDGEPVYGWEGCLSVPGQRGRVARHPWLRVRYRDRSGEEQTADLTDFVARIFQHELDHLEGRLFVDRVESPDDLLSEAEFLTRLEQGTLL